MISFYRKYDAVTGGNEKEIELRGLSTDTKPTTMLIAGEEQPIPNGTTFIEMNTGKIYLYDAQNEQWREM